VADPRPAVRTLARLARVLEHACDEVTLAQYRVLAMVAGGDERASRLAGRLSLTKPTVSAAVDGLVERGLIVRAAVAEDRRAVRLKVTPEGRRVLVRTERIMADRLRPVFDRTADPDAVVAALAELAGALDAVMAERR
jgi:DNA-binding MarR family transcriptional regulator